MEGYIYDSARLYAHEAEEQAKAQVNDMTLETLRKEYIGLTGLVAYYTKVEREMTKPRLHLDAIKALLVKLKAEEVLQQYETAEQDGIPVGNYARVPTKPLIDLLSRLQQMTSS